MGKTFRLAFVRDGHGDTNAHVRASGRQRQVDKKRARQEAKSATVEGLSHLALETEEHDEANIWRAIEADGIAAYIDGRRQEEQDAIDRYGDGGLWDEFDADLMRDERDERLRVDAMFGDFDD